MSLQLATRILHVKDGDSYDTIDILRGAKGESPDIDDALSDVSENPVQNKVIKGALDDKVDVESGKGLSTNDFTTTLKDKLTKTNVTYCTCATSGSTATKVVSIASGANTNFNFYVGAIVAVKFTYSNIAQNPKLNVNNTGAMPVRANGSQITTTYLSYAGYANRTILYMYNGVEWTFLGWDTDSSSTYSDATQSVHGLMSTSDKIKLDGIDTGANKTVVDDALDGESTNPVQNAVVTEALDGKADIADLAPAYSTSGTYAVGDYVTYNGNVYRCTTAISTAEAWTPAHWTQVAIGTELTQYNGDLRQLSSSIAPVESSATATAAHAVGELFMVGETLMVALSAIAIGDTITTEGGSPNAAVTTLSSKLLKDVQINGTSVVSQGVANIPMASANDLGLAKIASYFGININGNGQLFIAGASGSTIKVGGNGYAPITPDVQHYSAFYGLAKAASDTTQSASSNAVGTYTETALSKISDMLNAPVSVSGTTPSITAKSGVRYVCGEVSTLSIVAPASGCIDVVFESGSTPTVLTVTSAKTGVTAIKWANGFDDTSLDADTTYEINILDGEYGVVASWT